MLLSRREFDLPIRDYPGRFDRAGPAVLQHFPLARRWSNTLYMTAMKSSLLLTILLCTLTATVATSDPSESRVEMVKSKDKNVLVLKMDKKFIGANIEVLTATRDCVICQKATGRRTNINLRRVEAGSYTVKIEKDELIKEFQFKKE